MKLSRPTIAVAAAVSVALALPTAAAAATQVTFRGWTVRTDRTGNHNKIQPGTTFRHCPNDPARALIAHGYVNGAQQGKSFKFVWRRNGNLVVTQTAHWINSSGYINPAIHRDPPRVMQDGEWSVAVVQNGQRLARTRITLKTTQAAC